MGKSRDADVALVTPLRDDINLTGNEFVACRCCFPFPSPGPNYTLFPRIAPERPGVLILSPFMASADKMLEVSCLPVISLHIPLQALLVNPYEVGRVTDCLHRALSMAIAEAEVLVSSLPL